jgi:hypothetical protein
MVFRFFINEEKLNLYKIIEKINNFIFKTKLEMRVIIELLIIINKI